MVIRRVRVLIKVVKRVSSIVISLVSIIVGIVSKVIRMIFRMNGLQCQDCQLNVRDCCKDSQYGHQISQDWHPNFQAGHRL